MLHVVAKATVTNIAVVIFLMKLAGIMKIAETERTKSETNKLMNLVFTICPATFGNGVRTNVNRKAKKLFLLPLGLIVCYVAATGSIKQNFVRCHTATFSRPTAANTILVFGLFCHSSIIRCKKKSMICGK